MGIGFSKDGNDSFSSDKNKNFPQTTNKIDNLNNQKATNTKPPSNKGSTVANSNAQDNKDNTDKKKLLNQLKKVRKGNNFFRCTEDSNNDIVIGEHNNRFVEVVGVDFNDDGDVFQQSKQEEQNKTVNNNNF